MFGSFAWKMAVNQNISWLIFRQSTNHCRSVLLCWCECLKIRCEVVCDVAKSSSRMTTCSFSLVELVCNLQAVKCRERASWQLRTDPLVVLLLRLINTASLVRMHYGSFVAVYCLALRGVGCRRISQPIRHLKGKNQLQGLSGSYTTAAMVQDCAANMAARWTSQRWKKYLKCHLHLHMKQRWLQRISIPASSPSALQNLFPLLPAWTGSRAFTEVNVLMSETDWHCSAVV